MPYCTVYIRYSGINAWWAVTRRSCPNNKIGGWVLAQDNTVPPYKLSRSSRVGLEGGGGGGVRLIIAAWSAPSYR